MTGGGIDRRGPKDSENAHNSFLTKSTEKGFWRFVPDIRFQQRVFFSIISENLCFSAGVIFKCSKKAIGLKIDPLRVCLCSRTESPEYHLVPIRGHVPINRPVSRQSNYTWNFSISILFISIKAQIFSIYSSTKWKNHHSFTCDF